MACMLPDHCIVRYRSLPGTTLDLSVVGFGCWAIGGKYWGAVDDEESKRAVAHAVELGINWFDTAPIYGDGHADRILTQALGARRHDVVIATKVGPRSDLGEHVACDLTPKNIRRDVEDSLSRLELDTIPLVQVHWPCERDTPLEDSIGALMDLRSEGKIGNFGLCNYAVDQVLAARDMGAVRSLQTPYSMVQRELERNVDTLETERIGVLVYEPLCRGLLTGKFTARPEFPDTDMRSRDMRFTEPAFSTISHLVEALRIIAGRVDTTPAALAIAWTLRHRAVCATIAGAKTPAQVEENVGAAELLDKVKVWQALEPYVDRCRV
jgi:aryl-alcohol dehydrogenase-like predicted oxidoreductase